MGLNWDLAPEGTEKLVQYEVGVYWVKKGFVWECAVECWEENDSEESGVVIATRPQERKTLQDVLEAYPNGWPESRATTAWENWKGTIRFGDTITKDTICTREEYEKARAEKAEQEWTHRTNAGELCKIHVEEPDVNGVIIVLNERGEYLRHNSDSLKPIKTQITKAQAYEMFMSGYTAEHIKETYDVVDELSEVQS